MYFVFTKQKLLCARHLCCIWTRLGMYYEVSHYLHANPKQMGRKYAQILQSFRAVGSIKIRGCQYYLVGIIWPPWLRYG